MIATPARVFVPVLLCGMLLLQSCSTYRNATAYFNTYYNASQVYEKALAGMKKTPQTARDSNYFAPYKLPASSVQDFEKVIEKGSKLIQFHAQSSYVEDAIMMIGKSYLYQNETESAAAKFRELVENFPSSDKRAEATLWLAKALYQGNNDDQALTVAKELATPAQGGSEIEVSDDILLETTMLEAQIYADRGEFAQAAAVLDSIDELGGSSELHAIAQFQLGTVYEQTGEYAGAAEAYHRVGDHGPTPTMQFNAKLREGVMLSRAGDPEAALETFDEIIGWPLKIEQSALVDLEIANAYWNQGDSVGAFTLYEIIDSTYRRTDAAARSYYQRAEIYEKHYRQLDSARSFYQKAKSEYPSSSVTPLAAARFASLEHFLKTRDRLAADDSALQVMLNPPDSATLAVDSARLAAAGDTSAAGTDSTGRKKGMFSLGFDPSTMPTQPPPKQPPPQTELRPAPGGPVEILSMRVIRNRPRHLVPDPEDPDEASRPPETAAGAPETPESALAGKMRDDSTPVKPQTRPQAKPGPKAPNTPEGLRRQIAESEYELGGIFLLDLELPDSALVYYDRIVRDHPQSPLVPKTLYAMSEAHKALGDTATVDSLHDRILTEYPETEYARQVKAARGLDTTELRESPAERRYRLAEEALFAGESQPALDSMRSIAANSGDTLIAPKAIYAVGWIYENVLIDLDSADAWYSAVIRDYPGTAYATSAEPRVAVRADSSKLKEYVKFKKIDAIAKPQRKALGQIPKEQGKGTLPGMPIDPNKPNPDDDEYFNPGDDEEDEPADPDDEPADEDDDPGRPLDR